MTKWWVSVTDLSPLQIFNSTDLLHYISVTVQICHTTDLSHYTSGRVQICHSTDLSHYRSVTVEICYTTYLSQYRSVTLQDAPPSRSDDVLVARLVMHAGSVRRVSIATCELFTTQMKEETTWKTASNKIVTKRTSRWRGQLLNVN